MASRRAFLLSILGLLVGTAAAFRLPFFKPATRAVENELEAVESALQSIGKSLKHYATEAERELRTKAVKANLAKIKAHNSKSSSWKMGVTNFIGMTAEEQQRYLGVNSDMLRHQARTRAPLKVDAAANVKGASGSTSSSSSSTSDSSSSSDLDEAVREVTDRVLSEAEASALLLTLPKHWDWREHGVVSPVKSQGGCGSCWSFSAAEAIESAHAIATGELVVLSEQNILDCTPNPLACGGHGGCTGATPEIAFAAMQSIGGITTEELYPYESSNGTDHLPCRFSYDDTPIAAEVSGYVKLPPNDYARVMHAVATIGPLSVNVDATKFFLYREGVFDACENTSTSDIDHAVVLVGYGTDEATGLDYWLIRNSWSEKWGDGGYLKLKRTREVQCYDDPTPDDGSQCEAIPGPTKPLRVCGDCGVLFDVSYPLVLKPNPESIRGKHNGKEEPTVTEAIADAVETLVDLALDAVFDD